MPAFEIPLLSTPQNFSITLNKLLYNVFVQWNDPAGCWIMDIADANDNSLLQGVPLVTGADLLEQYAYLGIGGSLIVQTDNNTDAIPTFTNLGVTSHLYFVTT